MGRYQVEGHETAESLGGASQTLADHHLEGALEILDICRQPVGQQIIIHHMQEGGGHSGCTKTLAQTTFMH